MGQTLCSELTKQQKAKITEEKVREVTRCQRPFLYQNPKKRPMSIKSLIYINYCLLLHKLHRLTLPTLLLTYSLPSHAFEELPSSSALLNQMLGKCHSHSGKFTRSLKNSTPTVQ